ncbi:50S ribosomal protein L29 [Patescibacteria group bacterium]|nr:50S ribosomal protein L29 [Patescibacteria group bacterium]MBU4453059.1 50S ribosomal protein L29 [Patescibacteria group bacterium]MCG2687558.1 50S ribosomal protein L29 [Candidatus Parcubacteria bacterium]
MEYKDLEKKDEKELVGMLSEQRGLLYELRMKISVNQLKDVREVREVRKVIAQILSQLRRIKGE